MPVSPERSFAEELAQAERAPTVLRRSRFGRYELVYELASGGMATIHLARARGPGRFARMCVIKKIHAHLAADKDFVRMFLDEAMISARIRHPNVCSVLDFGELDGAYYLALEYLEGEPLSQVLRAVSRDRARLGSTRWHALAARIIADAAEGLHAAHGLTDDERRPLHVVHRDVSPQNLFVTYVGAVSVLDFGIAFANDRHYETVGAMVKGKYAYISPERLDGAKADRRADVWALGVCLWECLAGARLFRRESDAATLAAVRRDEIVPPSAARPGIPAALDRIALRALARDPDQRYATAREVGQELQAFVRSSNEPADLPALAAWMSELFSEEMSTKRSMVTTTMGGGGAAAASDVFEEAGAENPTTVSAEHLIADEETALFGPRAAARSGERTKPIETSSRDEVPTGPLGEPADTVVTVGSRRGRTRPGASRGSPGPAGNRIVIALVAIALSVALGALGLALLRRSAGTAAPETAITSRVAPPAGAASPAAPEPAAPMAPASPGAPAPDADVDRPEPGPDAAARDVESPGAPVSSDSLPAPPVSSLRGVDSPPEPPARPRARFGVANIAVSGGWADVYEGGRRIGRAPGQLRLRPGRHLLELFMMGRGPPRRVAVNVRAGSVERVVVRAAR